MQYFFISCAYKIKVLHRFIPFSDIAYQYMCANITNIKVAKAHITDFRTIFADRKMNVKW